KAILLFRAARSAGGDLHREIADRAEQEPCPTSLRPHAPDRFGSRLSAVANFAAAVRLLPGPVSDEVPMFRSMLVMSDPRQHPMQFVPLPDRDTGQSFRLSRVWLRFDPAFKLACGPYPIMAGTCARSQPSRAARMHPTCA